VKKHRVSLGDAGVFAVLHFAVEAGKGRGILEVNSENPWSDITAKGMYYFHYYEYDYTLSYIDQMWNRMGVQAFPGELLMK
jgi:hypothetical protein